MLSVFPIMFRRLDAVTRRGRDAGVLEAGRGRSAGRTRAVWTQDAGISYFLVVLYGTEIQNKLVDENVCLCVCLSKVSNFS